MLHRAQLSRLTWWHWAHYGFSTTIPCVQGQNINFRGPKSTKVSWSLGHQGHWWNGGIPNSKKLEQYQNQDGHLCSQDILTTLMDVVKADTMTGTCHEQSEPINTLSILSPKPSKFPQGRRLRLFNDNVNCLFGQLHATCFKVFKRKHFCWDAS